MDCIHYLSVEGRCLCYMRSKLLSLVLVANVVGQRGYRIQISLRRPKNFGNVQIASIDGTRPRSKETAAAIIAIMSGASDQLRR